jgi:RNA polymerase sigma-70 factor (ECF subfamily)
LRSHSHKQQSKNQSLDDSVNWINRNEKVTSGIDHIGLREVISKLKPEYVKVINMAYFGGYTQEEIAKELNLPLGTVKTRVRTALIQLREIMQVK